MERATYQGKMTAEERDAVDAFAIMYGRRWRADLRECMAKASYPLMSDDQASALQRVRNRRGVSWLARYVAPSKYQPSI